MPSLDLVAPPAVEPVTVDEAKLWLRVDDTAEDALIAQMITSARDYVEGLTGERLVTQEWRWTLDLTWRKEGILSRESGEYDQVPERYADKMIRSGLWIRHQPHLYYPIAPLQEITAFTYRLAGADQVYDYSGVRVERGGALIFDPFALPPLSDEQFGAVSITATVGYGVDASAIPGRYIQAIQMLLDHWYENRGVYMMPDGQGRILPGEMAHSISNLVAGKRRLRL